MDSIIALKIKYLHSKRFKLERSVKDVTDQLDKTLIELRSLNNAYPRISRIVPEEVAKKKKARRLWSEDGFVTKRSTAESRALTEKILGILAGLAPGDYTSHRDVGEILWDEYGESVNWDKARIYAQVNTRLLTLCKHGSVENKKIKNKQNQTSFVYRLVNDKCSEYVKNVKIM